MKYKLKVTIIMLIFFILAQLIGLLVTASYKEYFYVKEKLPRQINQSNLTNITKVTKTNLSLTKEFIPEKIEIKSSIDFVQIIASFLVALVIATVVFIILMRIGVIRVMRAWLFLVVLIGLFISFSLILYILTKESVKIFNIYVSIAEIIALVFAFLLAYYKIYKRDIIIHNLSELFIYPGIVVLFLPLVNIYIALALLLLVSIYDVIAVFKTRHMQKMAKFMIKDVRAFTGLLFPWIDKKEKIKLERIKKKAKGRKVKIKINIAALGGGDIALPMLFANVVFLTFGLINALFVILFATIGLALLLLFGRRDKAYPALPPLALGSIIGYLIGFLI